MLVFSNKTFIIEIFLRMTTCTETFFENFIFIVEVTIFDIGRRYDNI